MDKQRRHGFTVITNSELETVKDIESTQEISTDTSYQSNPMYEKLMNFRNLQDKQKKRFSVDDLFKLC